MWTNGLFLNDINVSVSHDRNMRIVRFHYIFEKIAALPAVTTGKAVHHTCSPRQPIPMLTNFIQSPGCVAGAGVKRNF